MERVADFIQDSYATTLTTGDIIMGFDIPAPKAPLRWGFAKVARKSGAFAHSIAHRHRARQGRPGLGGARRRRPASPSADGDGDTSLRSLGSSEEQLRAAIATDLDAHFADLDAYQKRMHTANILRAVREMRAQ